MMKRRIDFPAFDILQKKSDFFCPAKWTELYLYLNHGNSNSCHHPIPHAIPEDLLTDPYVLHNTPHKLQMQEMMMSGQRPPECHMCWHVEDLNSDVVSDRVIKSQDFWLDHISDLEVDPHYVPKYIEVVFDNLCNLACSYCDSGQSSSWASRISHDPWNLKTDHRNLYNVVHIKPGITRQAYLDAWNKWWPMISAQVETLRISGGEPLISPNFWHWVESFDAAISGHLDFSINSNLSVDQKYIERLIEHSAKFKRLRIAASLDCTGELAEYARQGLNYDLFMDNLHRWCRDSGQHCQIYLQSTVNVLNVWNLKKKFELAIDLRSKYPGKVLGCYSTVVRSPEFQSINLLPLQIRHRLAGELQTFVSSCSSFLVDNEQTYLEKIIAYLSGEPEPMLQINKQDLTTDLKRFLLRYNVTAKHDYRLIYPDDFVHWIDSISLESAA